MESRNPILRRDAQAAKSNPSSGPVQAPAGVSPDQLQEMYNRPPLTGN
ncbi:MAG: hypothetical protein F2792_07290, partial [Actinobacteria bacterium]|nr:hypothetical protein [Actinomycetota bacterium]